MLQSFSVSVSQSFNAPVADVFAVLSDHNQLKRVFGIPVTRIKDGKDSANGVGSVRRLGPPPFGVQETVTAVEPNARIDYVISKFGGPVMNHSGCQRFSEKGSGSELTWEINFSSLPGLGHGVVKVLETALSRGLAKLNKQL